MMFIQALITLAFALSGCNATAINSTSEITERKADAIPFAAFGSVAAIQLSTGDTRIHHQKPDGSIWQAAVSGVFFQGKFAVDQMIVPAGEALLGTPIASTVNGNYADVHLFFFSPSLIVSEYMWTGTEWIGASKCPQCITSIGFLAATSQFLYAMENSITGAPAKLRVGFNSAGIPGGLTEAAQVNGVWQLAVMT
ncbi:hypothetical protein C8J56DRAFT_942139 [Mycena floridula]|nr:hypothetical protein C8J56DRAFT_942139 [Mycena floridula]